MRHAILLISAALLFATPPAAAQSLFGKAKSLLGETPAAELAESEIAAGLREALSVAADRVVAQLGAADGYLADPEIHIPLPGSLGRVDRALDKAGLGTLTDELEIRLNRAAEAAAPRAKALFVDSIRAMTLDDARAILSGPDDAATQYLRRTAGTGLADEMRPVIASSLADVGALESYDATIAAWKNLPFVPDVRADLESWTLDKAMDGLFHHIAIEEAAIRNNPAKRTTDLLKTVFGAGT